MSRYPIRLTLFAVLSVLLATTPVVQQAYAAGDPPASDPPPASKKKKGGTTSYMEDPAFTKGYRTAYTTIYDRNDYAAAIEQLKALGHDDNAAGRQFDRLFLSEARRLQGVADLVRARAQDRS